MPKRHHPLKQTYARALATCFGLGYRTRWPGTLTSAVTAIVLFVAHSVMGAYFSSTILAIITLSLPILLLVLFIIGVWSSHILLSTEPDADPPHIVIDEVVGQAFTLWLTQSQSLLDYGVCFVLFRFFDIVKPPPIRQLEHMGPPPLALMHDDVAAALYASAVFILVPMGFAFLLALF